MFVWAPISATSFNRLYRHRHMGNQTPQSSSLPRDSTEEGQTAGKTPLSVCASVLFRASAIIKQNNSPRPDASARVDSKQDFFFFTHPGCGARTPNRKPSIAGKDFSLPPLTTARGKESRQSSPTIPATKLLPSITLHRSMVPLNHTHSHNGKLPRCNRIFTFPSARQWNIASIFQRLPNFFALWSRSRTGSHRGGFFSKHHTHI